MARMRRPASPVPFPHSSTLFRVCLIGLPLLGCSSGPDTYRPMTHTDRVIEDVGAMIEGMGRAHSEEQYEFVAPSLRSSTPR